MTFIVPIPCLPAISPNDKKVMNVVPPFLLIIFLIAESSQAATAAAIEEAAEQADYIEVVFMVLFGCYVTFEECNDGRDEAKKIVTAALHHTFSPSPLSESILKWTMGFERVVLLVI